MSGALDRLERKRDAAAIIGASLSIFDLSPSQIHLNDWGITELTSTRTISDAIFEATAPSVTSAHPFAHFTDTIALSSMLNSRELRLYSVRKRLGEDELTSFIDEHDLTGYRQTLPKGEPYFRTLAADLFYISLTSPGLSEEEERVLWSGFGDWAWALS